MSTYISPLSEVRYWKKCFVNSMQGDWSHSNLSPILSLSKPEIYLRKRRGGLHSISQAFCLILKKFSSVSSFPMT